MPIATAPGGPASRRARSIARWVVDNRTKRARSLDPRRPEGPEALHRLLRRADVFVTDAPMDSRERLGLRWEGLEPLNSRLRDASITAYGEKETRRPRPGTSAARAARTPRAPWPTSTAAATAAS